MNDTDTLPIGLTDKTPTDWVALVRSTHARYIASVADLTGIDPDALRVGVKATNVDLTTHNGYRWPLVRSGDTPVLVEATDWAEGNSGSCPHHDGDGLCYAVQAAPLTSGNVASLGCATGLVVVAETRRSLSSTANKYRCPRLWVVDTFAPLLLLRGQGVGHDLSYANLGYANLRYYADLGYADLSYADLRYADLGYADLRSANLGYADLGSADLRSANLSYANLRSANLSYANLRSANLRSADLRSANLRYQDRDDLQARGAVL